MMAGSSMYGSDLAAAYRLNAAKCVDVARRSSNLEARRALLVMAQAWLTLAEQAIKNSETVLVYETPVSRDP